MRGAIPALPNTSSCRGTQLKTVRSLPLPLPLPLCFYLCSAYGRVFKVKDVECNMYSYTSRYMTVLCLTSRYSDKLYKVRFEPDVE
jgi:hypothetical protein